MSAKRARFVWHGPPDQNRAVGYTKRSPEPGKKVYGVILSDVIHGVVLWYDPPAPGKKGRSQPCTDNPETCEGCKGNRDHAWKGYLPCWDWREGRLFIAEITRAAYLGCPGFEVFKGQLRGKVLTLERAGMAPNSRVTAELSPYRGEPGTIPQPFNLEPALERIWFGADGPKAREYRGDGPKDKDPSQGSEEVPRAD